MIDYIPGATVVIRFNTEDQTGAPITLAGTPAVSVYKNSVTETTVGVTLTVDFDGHTGLHSVAIDTSDAFYTAGSVFDVVITTGTVSGISAVGDVVGTFSLGLTPAAVFAQVIEGSTTFLEAQRAVLAGDANDVTVNTGSGVVIIKSQDGGKDRVTATTDVDGNRTVTGRDLS